MIVYKYTNVKVEIIDNRANGNFIIKYGDSSITSCHISELLFLN